MNALIALICILVVASPLTILLASCWRVLDPTQGGRHGR